MRRTVRIVLVTVVALGSALGTALAEGIPAELKPSGKTVSRSPEQH